MILLDAVVEDGNDDAFAGHVLRPSAFHRHVEATTPILKKVKRKEKGKGEGKKKEEGKKERKHKRQKERKKE